MQNEIIFGMEANWLQVFKVFVVLISGVVFAQQQPSKTTEYISYNSISASINTKYRWNNQGDIERKGFLSDLNTIQGVKLWNRISLGVGFGLNYESTQKKLYLPLLFDVRYYSYSFNENGTYLFLQFGPRLNIPKKDYFRTNQGTTKIGVGSVISEFNNKNKIAVDIFIQGTNLSFSGTETENFLNTSSFGFSFIYIIQ